MSAAESRGRRAARVARRHPGALFLRHVFYDPRRVRLQLNRHQYGGVRDLLPSSNTPRDSTKRRASRTKTGYASPRRRRDRTDATDVVHKVPHLAVGEHATIGLHAGVLRAIADEGENLAVARTVF